MKKCPSCNADCDNGAEFCATCGHTFESSGTPKRTMMGFPSLAAALQEAEDTAPEEPVKQTLFGFPAQKALAAEEDGDDAPPPPTDEDDGDGATSIIHASAFSFDSGSISTQDFVEEEVDEDIPPTMESDLRGTVAGMPLKPRDEYTDDATEIVSGTAVFPGMRGAPSDQSGEDDLRNKGTLMGMSLADVQAAAPPASNRSTQFAIPAVQAEKMQAVAQAAASEEAESLDEESEEEHDSPTMAWSPGALGKSDDKDGRKKLLEKIRKSRPVADADAPQAAKPGADAGTGPDLSALRGLKPMRELQPTPPEFPDESERDTNEQPSAPSKNVPAAAGVIQKASPKRLSDTGSTRPPVGASGYSFGPGETPSEGSLESISDPEFALMETDIASGEILQQAVQNLAARGVDVEMPKKPSPPAPAQTPQPAPMRTESKGIYETFDGGMGSAPKPQAAPPANSPGPMTVPTQLPQQPLQPLQPQQQPQHQHQPPPQSAPPQAKPFQPSPEPAGPVPYVPPTASVEPDGEEKLVRYIQAAFAAGGGIVAVVVQIVLLKTSGIPVKLGGVFVVALGAILGLAALFAAAYPLPAKIRSLMLYVLAGALFLCGVLGVFGGSLPNAYLAICLAALLAAVAGAFPSFARFLA